MSIDTEIVRRGRTFVGHTIVMMVQACVALQQSYEGSRLCNTLKDTELLSLRIFYVSTRLKG